MPEVVLRPPTRAAAAVDANIGRGVAVTDATIGSLAGGERMDLDWTMTVVCGNRDVAYPPRSERSAEHSGDEWVVEIPLDPEDDVLAGREGHGP